VVSVDAFDWELSAAHHPRYTVAGLEPASGRPRQPIAAVQAENKISRVLKLQMADIVDM